MLAFLRMTNNAISGDMHKARRLANDHQRELTIVAVTLLTYITYSLLTAYSVPFRQVIPFLFAH